MPRIPAENYGTSIPTADVGAAASSGLNFDSNAGMQYATLPGQQVQNMGNAMQGLSQQGMQIATTFQDQINQARVQDVRNQLASYSINLADDTKDGWKVKTGKDAFNPEDGKTLSDVYLDKFNAKRDELMGSLDNDRQRLMLTPHAADLALQVQSDTQQYALQQFKNYHLSNLNGQLKLSVDQAERSWNDPSQVNKSLVDAQTAVANAGIVQGKAPSEIATDVRTTSSLVHLKVLNSAIANNNPSYASLYFQDHKDPKYDKDGLMLDGGMGANDILQFQGTMNKVLDNKTVATGLDATVKNFAPQIAPTPVGSLASSIKIAESGGQQFDKDGNTTIGYLRNADGSLKLDRHGNRIEGGIGVMQVTLSTGPEAAKLAGLPWDESKLRNDPVYNEALGTAYLQAQVQKFGNAAMAAAAYNAGAGAVQKAVSANGSNWISGLPKETQDYVAKVNKLMGSGGAGVPQLPTEQEFINYAMSTLGPSPRPEQVQLMQTQAKSRFDIMVKSQKEIGDRAYDNLLRGIFDAKGDMTQVPALLQSEMSRLDPQKWEQAIKTADILARNFNGANTALNVSALNTSIFHPERLADMSEGEFKSYQVAYFPRSEWDNVAKRRDDYINGRTDNSQDGINHKALDPILMQRMVNIGIDPAKAAKDPVQLQRVDAIKSYVAQSVLDQQQQLGRKMTELELGKFTDGLFAKDVNFQSTFMGMKTGTSSARMMGINVGDLPDGAYAGIKQAFVANGIKNPTDTDILKQYWRMHK